MKLSKVKGIIFDMDGVIFDSEAVWQRAFVAANEKFNSPFIEADRQSWCGMDEQSIRNKLKEQYPSFPVDEYREYIISFVFNVIHTDCADVKAGFEELISYLKAHGYKTALATSAKTDRAALQFEKKGLERAKLFDCETYSGEVKVSKPNPEIFLKAAQKLNLPPQECIVLEDSLNGVEAAVRGGFQPVMVIDLIAPTEKERNECVFIADNLGEVLRFLKGETK